ncbi:MAG: serine/threonine protein kinase [Duncaniella sp.]|nr:serine/threonine protein kinase [Duncaniella sp.]
MAIVRLQGAKEKKEGVYYEVDTASTPIGEGGMGKVYAGKSVNTKTGLTRPVAIKFMFMELPEQAIERARRESSIQLRNDNLVEMLGFIETEEIRSDGNVVKHYHVVSELLNGVSLADVLEGKVNDCRGNEVPYARKLLNDFSKSPEHFAKIVIKAVLSGLMALHDAGYIHRDIDPSNIMITDDGKIKLIDFGICKQMNNLTTHDKALTVANTFMGKPEYASPELCLGDIKHHNQTTDIYAVGMLLYQCIVGHVPFEGSRYQIVEKQTKEKVPLKAIKDKELRRIIGKACEKRQELRYQTSAEMRVDIESLDVKRAADPRKRRLYIMAGVIVLLCVAGSVVGVSFYKSNAEAKRQALIEKQYTDSLGSVVEAGLAQGRKLAAVGFAHDENYDEALVAAMGQYARADSAAALLAARNITVADYKAETDSLNKALNSAYWELKEKADILQDDPDPEVVAEVEFIRKRLEAISNATTIEPAPAPAETEEAAE